MRSADENRILIKVKMYIERLRDILRQQSIVIEYVCG